MAVDTAICDEVIQVHVVGQPRGSRTSGIEVEQNSEQPKRLFLVEPSGTQLAQLNLERLRFLAKRYKGSVMSVSRR